MKKLFKKNYYCKCNIFFVLPFSCKKENSNPYNNGRGGSSQANQVYIQDNMFSPASISVSKGTTIIWTNKDNIVHTVTSNTNLFDSGDMGKGKTYSRTFSGAGSFAYNGKYHVSMGMTGTVIVR